MKLRDVAAYLGTTETGIERMIREGKFPKANRTDPRLRIKEWAARHVVKWKRENVTWKALA